MAALEASPTPSAFPIAARAIRTPMPNRPGLISVLVGVSGRSLSLGKNDDGTKYFVGATVLTRVVDKDRREVARASQQYQFTGDYAQRNTQRRPVLFFKTATLLQVRHTLEAVVYDVMAEKSSVRRLPVEAIAASDKALVGDVIVAGRVEPVPADQPGAAQHPLVWQGMLYTPSLGEPISLATQTGLTVALPMVVAGEAATAMLELRQGSAILRSVALPVNGAQPDGRLLLVGRLAVGELPAGKYEVRVTVTRAATTTTRTTTIALVE